MDQAGPVGLTCVLGPSESMNVMFSRFTPIPGPFLHLSADLPLLLLPACLSPDLLSAACSTLLSAPTSFVALSSLPALADFPP